MRDDHLLERISELDNNPKMFISNLNYAVDLDAPIESLEQAQDLLLLGRGHLITGKHDVAAQMLHKALPYINRHGNTMSKFHCYSNLGIVYREEKRYDLALKALNKSCNISYDLEDFSFVILGLVNLASVHTSLGNFQKSMDLLQNALGYKDRIKNSKILGDLYNNYAFVMLCEKKYDDALVYFLESYNVYKRLYGDAIQTNLVIVLSNIGETYVCLGDYDNAELYINKALEYAQINQIKYIEQDCHQNLAKMYEAQGDYKAALYHQKTFTQIAEEVANKQIKEEIEGLKQRLEDESKKSEAEINLLRNVELKNKTTELEKTLKNLAHISQIGRQLTSSMDMNQIYEILRSSIYALMRVDVFGLALYDQSQGEIDYNYFEESGKALPLMKIDVNDRTSLASYCILHEEDLFIKSFYDEYQKYLPNMTYVPIGDNKENSTTCIIYCRLMSEEHCIGLITMQSYLPNEYSDADFEVIKALASYVAIAISNAKKKNIIIEKAQELEYLSYNDPLTGLYNRRYFGDLTEWYNRDAFMLPIGLIIGDMNYLKEINDTHGHQMGDQYLVEIAHIMKRHADGNPVFRLGGDEFAILIKNTSKTYIADILQKIQDDCKSAKVGLSPLSISLGYEIKESMHQTVDELFALAESRMYHEKNKYHHHKRRL
jgi:diguanylate cyclase (GGDEF)-like protein